MHALIIANGNIPAHDFVRGLVKFADIVVCADGGANHAMTLGIKPDIIIGDFDSITPDVMRNFISVDQLHIDDQNSTDLEKAVEYCLKQNVTSIDVVGASGDRIDHTIVGLGIFKKYGDKVHIRMLDTLGELSRIQGEIHLNTRQGEILSLIPLEICEGVTTKNLKYPLSNETLAPGVRDGLGNVATSGNVTITVRNGTLLIYRFRGTAWQFSRS